MKNWHKRVLFWSTVTAVSLAGIATVFVPPLINFDFLKPRLETAILNNAGLHATIGGNVRLSLLGNPKVIANQVAISEYNGVVDSAVFRIPWKEVFAPQTFGTTIELVNADLELSDLSTPAFSNRLIFNNSSVLFMGKKYSDINGVLQNGTFVGTVRTDDHKYSIGAVGGNFRITNPEIKLEMIGQLFSDSDENTGANGTLSIETDKINQWFGFTVPKFTDVVSANMKFKWFGDDLEFYDIIGETGASKFRGEIQIGKTHNSVKMSADNLDFDLSFILGNSEFLRNADIDLNLNGNLKFGDHIFSTVEFVGMKSNSEFEIKHLRAVNSKESYVASGVINESGAKGLKLEITKSSGNLTCDFYGTTEVWRCAKFDIKTKNYSATGSVSVNPKSYEMTIESDNLPFDTLLTELKKYFGPRNGIITFKLKGASGQTEVKSNNVRTLTLKADFVSLESLDLSDILPLPEIMLKDDGKVYVSIENGKLKSLDFEAPDWSFAMSGESFVLEHSDIKRFLGAVAPEIDLFFMQSNLPIVISGEYKKPYIRKLEIEFGTNVLHGYAESGKFNLKSNQLNIDELIDENFKSSDESAAFLHSEPLLAPLAIKNSTISLSTKKIVIGGGNYKNFVFALRPNSEQFSITDDALGNMLVSIDKNKNDYQMMIQANKFFVPGKLLDQSSPLNISDTVITAQANLSTFGQTSHDIRYNLSGDVDMTLDGGTLIGLGIDNFYKGALDITRTNAKDAIQNMFNGGTTEIKSMHIVGKYNSGILTTSRLFTLGAKHANISGNLQINNGKIAAIMNILLRGTSAEPKTLQLGIGFNGERNYSIDDAIIAIDPDYTVAFINSHDKF